MQGAELQAQLTRNDIAAQVRSVYFSLSFLHSRLSLLQLPGQPVRKFRPGRQTQV
ncbi:MAG: hypothetical protein MZU84_01985 [Sphingobacterium sp.]|nr:hypothetical protein [Sphingobacterium sp.]